MEYKTKKAKPVIDATTVTLLAVAGVCEGGPHNLAEGHAKYLYGKKKK